MITYKLFRQRKDGTLGPLFINATLRVPIGTWLPAEDHPTRGYAHRPGWHVGEMPHAPHLSENGRVWCECTIGNYYRFKRPTNQGGEWLIADRLRVDRILSNSDVAQIREQKSLHKSEVKA